MWDFLLGRPTTTEVLASTHAFEVDLDEGARQVFGIPDANDPLSTSPKISRKLASQVPAVKAARDRIVGVLGTVPLDLVGGDNRTSPSALLDQPELNVPRSVTWTRIYEDLFYDGVAWFKRTENDYRGYPSTVKRLDPEKVRVEDGEVWVDGRKVLDPARTLIRFDSPNEGILTAGARAIRTLLRLEAAAAKQSEDPMPSGYFVPTEGADPLEDDEILDVLTQWAEARRRRATGYVPAALDYKIPAFSPEQLQMSAARDHAVKEIARLTGLDPEDLGVSTTSRTYINAQQKRIERINDVLWPYSLAVCDRLRMRDITPRGYSVRADFTGYLRADDATRLGNYKTGLEIGLYSLLDIAQREGLPKPDPEARQVVQAARQITKEAAA